MKMRNEMSSSCRCRTSLRRRPDGQLGGAGPTNAYSTNGYSELVVMLSPGVILRCRRPLGFAMNAASPTWQSVAQDELPAPPHEPDDPGRRYGHRARWDARLGDANQAVLEAEIWNGTTWTTVAAMAEARMNSSAVLLDDGRVLIAGGEAAGRLRAQIYSPPYLFKGRDPRSARRPARSATARRSTSAHQTPASVVSVGLTARPPQRMRSTRTSASSADVQPERV